MFSKDIYSYRLEVLQAEHYDQTVELISQAFCQHEPMTHYLGITPEDFRVFAARFVKKAVWDGLSIVSVRDREIIACAIVDDLLHPCEEENLNPKFNTILSLLESLRGDYFSRLSFAENEAAHLFITAVEKKYLGKGLSKKVNLEAIKHAKAKGFDFMVCEFTHALNEQGTVKLLEHDKRLIGKINYSEFVYEGKKPFANLHGHAAAYIWALHEDADLNRLNQSIQEAAHIIP